MVYGKYKACIDACLECIAICNYCAASCLKEPHVQDMTDCILLDMQCAAICYTTVRFMSWNSVPALQLCTICADVCEACATECSRHDNEHCRACAVVCKTCAEECRKLLN